jgi:hypothetical protein
MNMVNAWAEKIAAEAAPDEIDLAPAMAEAFISGGKDREELFQRPEEGVLGAFGPGEGIAVFPWILHAIGVAAPLLKEILSADIVNKVLSIVKDILAIRDILKRKQEVDTLPDDPYAPFKKVVAVISEQLRIAGISPDQSDLITGRVLMALLKEPSEATLFIEKIAKTS